LIQYTFFGFVSSGNENKSKNKEIVLYQSKRVFFCTGMKAINKMKKTPTEWKKIFSNKITEKGLISKI